MIELFHRSYQLLFACLLLNVFMMTTAEAQDAPSTDQQSVIAHSRVLALQQAKHFLQVCDLPPIQGNMTIEQDSACKPALVWDINCNGYVINVEASTGHIVNFHNYLHNDQRYRSIDRTGSKRFSSLDDASLEIWRLARAIGIPDHAYLSTVMERPDSELIGHDPNPVDIMTGMNWAMQEGADYPVLGLSPGDSVRPGINIILDSQDGQLISVFQLTRSVVSSSTVALTGEQALRVAENAYQYWYFQDHSIIPHDNPSNAAAPELGYTAQSGLWDFIDNTMPPATDPIHFRLAWGVYFGEVSIFIDAATGNVLGGEILKGTGSQKKLDKPSNGSKPKVLEVNGSLRRLLQTVSEVQIYHRQSSPASPQKLLLVLSNASDKHLFLLLKKSKDYQRQAPAFADDKFVFTTSGNKSVSLSYDFESGLLGAGNQWCFVPDQFRDQLRPLCLPIKYPRHPGPALWSLLRGRLRRAQSELDARWVTIPRAQ